MLKNHEKELMISINLFLDNMRGVKIREKQKVFFGKFKTHLLRYFS